MGFFSWKTTDTDRSISNEFSSRPTFTVYMKDNDGGVWKEDSYEGYGVFGGKDYYQLVAEMSGHPELTGDVEKDRLLGISLCYPKKGHRPVPLRTPILVEDASTEWSEEHPEECQYQGFFYDEDDTTFCCD